MNNQELIRRLRETSLAMEQLALHLSQLESDTSTELTELAEPTESAEPTDLAPVSIETAAIDIPPTPEPVEIEPEVIEIKSEAKPQSQNQHHTQPTNQSQTPANNNPFARIVNNLLGNKNTPNPLQLFGNMANGSGGGNGKGGMPSLNGLPGLGGLNGNSLPTTLAELHDNPQLLGLLKNVSNNPQMLNVLSSLTGQDSQTLQQTLQSLQPAAAAPAASAAPAAPTATASATPAASANIAPLVNSALPMPAMAPAASSYLDSLLAEWHWQPYARAWVF